MVLPADPPAPTATEAPMEDAKPAPASAPTAEEAADEATKVAVVVSEEGEKKKPEEDGADPKPAAEEEKKEEEEGERGNVAKEEVVVQKSSSFKEDSNFLPDLREHESKALLDLRAMVEAAILENKLLVADEAGKEKGEAAKSEENTSEEGKKGEMAKSEENNSEEEGKEKGEMAKSEENNSEEAEKEGKEEPRSEELADGEAGTGSDVSLWGVPLLASKGSEGTDVILLKFLRAREFRAKEAFEMLRSTLRWRKDARIETILEEEEPLVEGLEAAAYMDGTDREGHPVCYNVYGVFQDAALYERAFGSEENVERFLRWRFRLMEKGIRGLDLRPGGVASMLQITDLKDSPWISERELRMAMKRAVGLLQDNYPEFVARNIFINVPFWYYAFNSLLSPFLTQRTKSKFVFARSAKVTETLLKYIPAEDIPIRYGGLKRENDTEFSVQDGAVSELIVKAGSVENVEIPVPEAGTILLWDLTVVGWEVNYKEEFVPTDEGSYTILLQKGRKMGYQEEPVRNSFRNNEPGKVVLIIENTTFWKKKVLFRHKEKRSS